ncbi:C40 family peptidase [Nocardioides sp. KIGAM211]|uniref:C40 family peptidase n=1 Tax=Nocardioides luti TaxID=2761101 RepID=A0A7X0RGD5_9ACTN|nr:C40 family peptidase [Nocardioides luti]MBB6626825.1 C40 family peptidase [Nocardioides luti]
MSAPRLRLLALPVLLPLIVVALLATTLGLAPGADAATRREKIHHARSIALHQIGDRYAYGAAGPRRFDCSGLVYYSYRKAGLSVPRTSSAQAAHARHIRKSHLRAGDFMYFHDGGGVYHVAIFLRWSHGHAVMLHAPGSGQRVHRDAPWTRSWFAGTLRGR